MKARLPDPVVTGLLELAVTIDAVLAQLRTQPREPAPLAAARALIDLDRMVRSLRRHGVRMATVPTR